MASIAGLIPESILDNLPSMVKTEVVKLSPERQSQFVEEYRRKAKSVGIAYVLWLVLSLHYAYVGKWGLTLLMWITFGGLFVWWLVDVFRIPGIVRNHNRDVAVDVLRDLKIISA